MALIDLPSTLRAWVADASGDPVAAARPHFAGVNREAWQVEVGHGSTARKLFLLRDKTHSGGSFRDAHCTGDDLSSAS